jgi:hypothetical protein
VATRKPAPKKRAPTPTAAAVRAELRDLGQRKTGIKDSAHAALAIAMAKRIDDPDTSASSAASCGRVLNDAMNELRALAPEKTDTKDGLDHILDAAAQRRAAP